MLRGLLVSVLALAVLPFTLGASSAVADGHCAAGKTQVRISNKAAICVVVTDPGTPGGAGAEGHAGDDGEGSAGCFKDGVKIACTSALGVWWPGNQCYAEQVDAPAGSPAWHGHSDGTVWSCSTCDQAGPVRSCNARMLWAPPGRGPGPPDPGQMAAEAIGLMRLPAARVHTAPRAPDHTYVGIENWLWVPAAQWKSLSKTVTAGSTSVTVTAKPRQVRWDMGPATTTCYAPGRAWRKGMTDAAKTNCGYTYSMTSDAQPHGRFSITATIRYRVDWTCAGACTSKAGSLGLVDAPAGQGALAVRQRQTVVIR